MPTIRRSGELVASIGSYVVASLGGVAVVKWGSYAPQLFGHLTSSWVVIALLSRATWILSYPLAVVLDKGVWWWCCRVTTAQLQIYIVIAIGLAVVEALNAVSLSILPGSLYALLKGTDVVWSMVLSYVVLGKQYTITHMAAVILIVTGLVVTFGLTGNGSPPSVTPEHAQATQQALKAAHLSSHTKDTSDSLTAAIGLCLLGALVNALVTVVTEATLKQRLHMEQESSLSSSMDDNSPHDQSHPSQKLVLSNQYAAWTSFFSFVLLTTFASMTGDLQQVTTIWPLPEVEQDDLNTRHDDDDDNLSIRNGRLLATLGLAALITLSRFAERIAKHFICVHDSALTFSVVQAARRLSGVYVMAALFHEDFPTSMLWGSLFVATGLLGHAWASSSRQVTATTMVHGAESQHGGMTGPKEHYEMVALTPPAEYDDDDWSSSSEGNP